MKINREEIVKALRETPINLDEDVLNHIFQCQATAILKLIEGESQREWISVAERLPDHRQNILMYAEKYDLIATAQYDGDVFIYGGARYRLKDEATHWKPLPAPPEGEKPCPDCGSKDIAMWSRSGRVTCLHCFTPSPAPEGERERTQKEAEEMLKNPLTIEEAKAQVDRLNKGEREEKPELQKFPCKHCGYPASTKYAEETCPFKSNPEKPEEEPTKTESYKLNGAGKEEGCMECGDLHDRMGDFCSDVCRARFLEDDPMQDGQESPFNDNEFPDEDYRF